MSKSNISPNALVKELALYRTSYGTTLVSETQCALDTWALVSEPVQVEFKFLADEERLSNEIAVLDIIIEETREVAVREMARLQSKLQDLLALKHDARVAAL